MTLWVVMLGRTAAAQGQPPLLDLPAAPEPGVETCSSELRTAGYLSSACWTAWPTVKGGGSCAAVGREPIVAVRITQPSDTNPQRRSAVTATLFERVLTWAPPARLSSWLPRALEDQPDGSGMATQ